jgi:hypothetical protein
MRVIIPCAGGSNRWANHCGVPKHLVKLCGERLLDRGVRLTNEITPNADVKVVVRDLTDRRYLVAGSTRSVAKLSPDNGDVDKIASSDHLWDRRDRTVVAFGDVWWSEPVLRSVLTDPIDGWRAWLRFGPGGNGGELFAFAFDPDAHDALRAARAHVATQHHAGAMAGIPGGWGLYRTLCGRPVDDHADHGQCTLVDDPWVDDMDTPDDWRQWCWRWAHADPATRPPKVT